MADDRDSPDDLYPFARALVRKLIRDRSLNWDSHRVEDAEQELFLAGWQVWKDQGDIGLAKNRMVSRKYNLLRGGKRSSEPEHPAEPKRTAPAQSPTQSKPLWDEESVRGWDRPSPRARLNEDPAGEAAVNDYLNSLPPRQRDVLGLRMAGLSHQEIADELGIGLRTVERELSEIRKKEKKDEQRT